MSTSTLSALLHFQGLSAISETISLALHSAVFGIHFLLVPIGSYVLRKKEKTDLQSWIILSAMLTSFALSFAYWIVRIIDLALRNSLLAASNPISPSFANYANLFNTLIFLNILFADSVGVWRAWVLCRDDSKTLLLLTTLTLIWTYLCVLVDIGVCTAMVVTNGGENPRLVNIQNVWQILTMVSSFLTNLSSTFIIGMKAWRLRRAIADAFQEHAQERHVTSAGPVLLLLIESGALYCIASIVLLVFMTIRLNPDGFTTLGDICTPMFVGLSGVYPTIVIVLVSMRQSMDRVMHDRSQSSLNSRTVVFAGSEITTQN